MTALWPIEIYFARRLAREGEGVAAIARRLHLNEAVVREALEAPKP